jgi:hypothetical protein
MVLENSAIRLTFVDGGLQAENLVSGCSHTFDFPAFQIMLGDVKIHSDLFEREGDSLSEPGASFRYLHRATGVEAEVRYVLDGDQPWFRKYLRLKAPVSVATPTRVWVDLQSDPPGPIRRVGYGLRGGLGAEEQDGLETYAEQPGCGYPVWIGDWFAGMEHPAAFTVPGEHLELFHHPVWNGVREIECCPAVFGVAADHDSVPEAFKDYLWHIRLPKLDRPLYQISVGWSTKYIGNREYIDSFETNEDYADALVEVGLKPDWLALDAGWFDRRTIYRHKEDDAEDSRLIEFAEGLRKRGFKLALWITHNGPVGFDTDWIQEQGWKVGEGPGTPYKNGTFVVMMQPSFEEALGKRLEQLVTNVGVGHLKIDWDNDAATHPEFREDFPTPDHVREATIDTFIRIDRRLRKANPELITRNGWWPSPWWLDRANHIWLADSGDTEYASWPSRTQRDRGLTHRDAFYHQIMVKAESPVFLDVYDNHEFVQALMNPFGDDDHTWLDNLVLAVTRGTTYIWMPVNPESLRDHRATQLQQVMEWMGDHVEELGTRDSKMVLGSPALGEVYGFLHPFEGGAWLTLRNPSIEPQVVSLECEDWFGYRPKGIRQVYPFWEDLTVDTITLLGHEVRLLRFARDENMVVSPIPGAPFLVSASQDEFEYSFPGDRQLTDEVGPSIHLDMQISGLSAEKTSDERGSGRRLLQWYAGIPHRFERPELIVVIHGEERVLDGLKVRAGGSRYRGVGIRYSYVTQHPERQERSRTSLFLPPPGPRDRDYYVFRTHESGWASITLEIEGEDAESAEVEAWLTGYESEARQTIKQTTGPVEASLLPVHPYGFSRCLKLT